MKPHSKLHGSIAAMFNAYNAAQKSERSDYDACAKFLRSIALNDAEVVKVARDDMLTTFGEAHKDAAQIRVNIMYNARRVAFGGTKDGKAIRGKGHAAMLEVVASVASVRELRKALSEAVPDALKAAGHGGDRKGKKSAKKSNAMSIPKVATREEAFAAARKVLEFCRDKFTKPSETNITERINAAIEVLK